MLQARELSHDGRRAMAGRLPEESPLTEAILQVVERIDKVLKEEQSLVSRLEFADIDVLIARKSHLELELGRLMAYGQDAMKNSAVSRAMVKLKVDLSENAQLLRRHMDAVCEISSVVAEALEIASADGTYSNQPRRPGPKSWSR